MADSNSEEQVEIKKEDKKVNLEKMFKVFSISLSIFLILLVGYLKFTLKEFNNWWILIVISFVVLLLLLVFFGFKKVKKIADIGKTVTQSIPTPRDNLEMYQLARDSIKNNIYWNDIKHFHGCRVFQVGKTNPNTIYLFQVETLFRDKKPISHIIINANYPEYRTVLAQPSAYEVQQSIKWLSVTKEEEPEIEEQTSSNPALGIVTTRKVSKPKSSEKKDEKEGKKELE